MKRVSVSLTVSVCMCLALATAFLLLTPFTTFAANTCTASCQGGSSVTCNATADGFCAATDNIGCAGATIKRCPNRIGEILE
jgi:hypothetical protein